MASPDFELFSSLRYDPLLTPLAVNTEAWDGEEKLFSPFYMLPYHRDRMLQAAEHFGWTKAADTIRGTEGFNHLLKTLTASIDTQSPTPARVKARLSHDGAISVESSTAIPAVTRWNLYPERIPHPSSDAASQMMRVSPSTGGALTLGDGDAVYGDAPKGPAWEVLPDTVRTAPSPFTSYKTTSRDVYSSARERVGITGMAEKREVLIVSEKEGEIMEGSLTSVFFWRDGKWTTPPVSSGGQIGTTRRWALEKGLCVEGIVKVDSLVDGEECWISNGVRGFQYGKIRLS
ncbi:aminodeoxychorismate lyase [Drepanopeziza brunnea f. sp. 'multigermtubi' MB_m1]|uniref:Aminodeoxychorismate lyase n=1 Tax=Marssonina brunnea f. sp. multigermtubi (strain MB_m1) TaxID=1072389 RepID=K1WGX9_MARBU|nr:aminodeoxychorismate lyase [Drepanopeziza brunnea f. sp. 'multigermtubi' MB_m1]EKD16835.1 aminodeoxychorismate lyase [Drepanopeziza brunnea f. sp. 'multigermtubi' MB_m1]